MNEIRKLIKNIDRGIALRKNLPEYGRVLSDTYLDYAAIELTFSAYMLSEIVVEDSIVSEVERDLYDQVVAQLRALLEGESVIEEITKLRAQITTIMDGFTSYTDQLVGYEYVLKRKKLKHQPEDDVIAEVKRMNEEEFLQNLMAYLVGNRDQSIVRDRLQMLMGQIPVHMTKQKLLEKVKEALSLYQGSDKVSLDNFVYMIRSSAMLHKAKAGVASAEHIEAFIEQLATVDLVEMTDERYGELAKELEEVTEEIVALTDYYFALQKVVNGIYALALARKNQTKESSLYVDCKEILWNIAKGGLDDSGLVKLEGKIENCVEKCGYLEAVLYEVTNSYRDLLQELGLLEMFGEYEAISSLLSDSLFIDLEKVQDDTEVDAEMIKKIYAELSDEMSKMFAGMQRPLRKAIMATVLEKLPVDFSNTSQIEEYIRTNLFGCQDFSEKSVVLLELQEQMTEASEWRSE
nr:hypothetical protein [Eubacterium sp.]